MSILENVVWSEKYRPQTVKDCILPARLKQTFQAFVDAKHIPSLLLAGGSGVGKTTIAKAMLEEIGCNYIVINASLDRNIDTLRTDIAQFASTVSLVGGRKYVILDEADYLNPQSFQPALRNFMEEFAENCGFILTCNFKNRIIPALQSRTSLVEFKFTKKELQQMAGEFMTRVTGILNDHHCSWDNKVLAQLIMQHLPDWRRILNELERYAGSGTIDTGILTSMSNESFKNLNGYLKEKNFKEMRKWVVENLDNDLLIYRAIYDNMHSYIRPQSIPALVLLISEYQYRGAFVSDMEIHMVAFLTNVMMEVEFV